MGEEVHRGQKYFTYLFYFENPSDASCEKAPHQEEEVKGSHPLAQWFVGRRGTEIFEGLKTLQS